MHSAHPRRLHGFTLIELLTVIAVIGILAAIIIPTVGKVRETAQRAVDANNLRELAKAALLYATDNRDALPNPDQPGRTITGGGKYHQWFGQLARHAGFNDPSLLISKSDGALDPTQVPPSVLDPADPGDAALLPAFAALGATSFNVVAGLRLSDPPTTPIAFSRGLRVDGSWNGAGTAEDDVDVGPYGSSGGHVVFLGGNVQFFRSLEGALTSNTGSPTSDLRQAVPNRSGVRIHGMDEGNGVASPAGVPAMAGP